MKCTPVIYFYAWKYIFLISTSPYAAVKRYLIAAHRAVWDFLYLFKVSSSGVLRNFFTVVRLSRRIPTWSGVYGGGKKRAQYVMDTHRTSVKNSTELSDRILEANWNSLCKNARDNSLMANTTAYLRLTIWIHFTSTTIWQTKEKKKRKKDIFNISKLLNYFQIYKYNETFDDYDKRSENYCQKEIFWKR